MYTVGAVRSFLRGATIVVALVPLTPAASAQTPEARSAVVQQYCLGCHNASLQTGGVILEHLDSSSVGADAGIWERVLRQVRTGQMPPAGLPRPTDADLVAFTASLESALDQAVVEQPNPGVTMPHRLNRIEYSNVIRDLLALDTKPGDDLPIDDSGNGFDNQANLLSMSPSLLERYMSLARSISRTAVGDVNMQPGEAEYGYQGRGDRQQPDPLSLPFGSRGGVAFEHYFPLDADYDIRVNVSGDGDPIEMRISVKAGLHRVVATFLRESARDEIGIRPLGRRAVPIRAGDDPSPAQLDLRMDGVRLKLSDIPQAGGAPEVGTITVAGPHEVSGRGDTPSRQKIFVCQPATTQQQEPCARTIFTNLTRRAFHRPVTEIDVKSLLNFYSDARADGGDFDEGIRFGLQALLVSPDFLFRVELDPKSAVPGSVYRLNDYELASRLSFFLWSSIPDDELLQVADEGQLHDPVILRTQVTRMMADPKSDALIKNFGGQWLYLRTLANVKPDPDIFAAFDEDLRKAFQRETELFLTSIFREDRSVLEMLDADYTFLNETLAKHYGVPNVYGPQFRKVQLDEGSVRGGLLGQGSILTVTSYPNRTSVVQRGKWILENLLGTPPPPPPPNVPELEPVASDGRKLSMREAMEQHRQNPVCASCHGRMDPIGFALENFDAVGTWRGEDGGFPIDAAGRLPNGEEFDGPEGLKKLLVDQHRDEFVETVAEKLMIYALGRGLGPYDKPTVRIVARQAAREGFRMSAFVDAVANSVPFQMRRAREQ
jgi:mono/diheme cytochrome c family protein